MKKTDVKKQQTIAGMVIAFLLMLGMIVTSWPAAKKAPVEFESKSLSVPAITQISLQTSGTIAINTADAEDLQELPGVGETMAQNILDERDAHGSFYYPEDLLTVRGIGEKKLSGLIPWLDFSPAQEDANP
ncbi:MAG: helix-hairpin-helix domain-containing protein [Clostridia bacterium]|nr:helix-hairpin-helix domain-containing protein [Clostridia bacterium]